MTVNGSLSRAELATPGTGVPFSSAVPLAVRGGPRRGAAPFLGVLLCVLVGASTAPSPASASTASPWWRLNSQVLPSSLPPGAEGTLILTAINVGDAPTSGAVTISEVLPQGLKVKETEVEGQLTPQVEFLALSANGGKFPLGTDGFLASEKLCEVTGRTVTCNPAKLSEERIQGLAEVELLHADWPAVHPYEDLEIRVPVKNEGVVAGSTTKGEISGGGAAPLAVDRPLDVAGAPPQFGAEAFSVIPEEAGGAVDTLAGSHPFQLTTTFALNQAHDVTPQQDVPEPPALPRDLQFKLPPGLIGNATSLPQCSEHDFFSRVPAATLNLCPAASAVGVASLLVDEPVNLHLATISVPLFNIEPRNGEPARFGFEFAGSAVTLDTSVRTGGDYGVTVTVGNITELTNFLSSTVTFWGVPDDPSHDASRGWSCLARGRGGSPGAKCVSGEATSGSAPFLTLPTSCSEPFSSSVEGDSWPKRLTPGTEPVTVPLPRAQYDLADGFGGALGITGCNALPFSPEIQVQPDGHAASSPIGMRVDVHVPQEANQSPQGVSSSNIKDISVQFPEGVTVNPAAADGLQACPETLAGFQGAEELPSVPGLTSMIFSPELVEPLQPGVNTCQDAAKIGKVIIKSPFLPAGQLVEGGLYLATPAPNGEPGKNPFDGLLAQYILAKDPVSGVVVKLPGNVTLDPVSGRVTATFKNNPQLTFEDAEVQLFGGQRAAFSTPSHCDAYHTTATFTPWSGGPAATSTSTFQVDSGPDGTPCPPASLPFSPSLAAGMTNINAAAFSPLVTTIGREDGNQDIQSVQLHMPPGLSGILTGVPLCGEAEANAGTCPAASLIGHTVVSVGLGNEPFSVTGGQVFLTEKYGGAPFGLSIVNPAKAGPFDLGKVVMRAKIEVDPTTAQLTVTTGAIPHILKGIPLQIKHVNVTVDRPGFTFNPTNCNPMAITATISSVQGATSPVSVPFQVTNCASLKFAPKFQVSTSGKTSKANGASLNVKLSYPSAPQGSQANIARVKVDLPKQLPSRLTTLQKACTSAQFNANPAGCPVASRIGFVTVTTPLLPVPLTGPAIFVSHGGEAFPSLTMVLQGYGVSVDLVGSTFISKAGITSTTFKTIPDVPFNTFALTLPQGKFSALAANGNLCKSSLVMPTSFVAQNGLTARQATKVAVTGCAKHKTKKTKKRRGARRGQHKPAKK